jgi:FKBP-type peptidyl-prolyl cis-trans isomerase/sugar lactone lactonase YvrE
MLSVSRRAWVFFAVFSATAWLGGPGCIPLAQPEEADPFGPDLDNTNEDQGDADEAAGGDSAAGASIFGTEGTRCADCHGEEEAADGAAPDLTGLDVAAIEAGVTAEGHPEFPDLDDQDLADLEAFLAEQEGNGNEAEGEENDNASEAGSNGIEENANADDAGSNGVQENDNVEDAGSNGVEENQNADQANQNEEPGDDDQPNDNGEAQPQECALDPFDLHEDIPPLSAVIDVVTTETGLCQAELAAGQGPEVVEGTVLEVYYTGWLEDGTVFDSRTAPDDPFSLAWGTGAVIAGWDEGLAGMLEGGSRRLIIPPELAYGEAGRPGIPANSILIFDVELVTVISPEEPEDPEQAPAVASIYWMDVDTNQVQKADPDGSAIEDLIGTGSIDPAGMAIDAAGGKIYWPESSGAKIRRANLDGSDAEDVIADGVRFPAGVALDLDSGLIYFTDRWDSNVHRAKLDGSAAEVLVDEGLQDPEGIALDLDGGRMYWADSGTDSIWSANLDGTDVQELVSSAGPIAFDIALDIANGHVYWTERFGNQIRRVDLDGGNMETVFDDGATAPRGLALDLGAAKMYFGDEASGDIMRANLDGTALEAVVSDGPQDPRTVALLFEDQ